METFFDIDQLIKTGSINNELDYERALISDRKLRRLSKEDNHFKTIRKKLRDIIEQYEKKEWSETEKISDEKLTESDLSEHIAETERVFLQKRKQIIRKKLKDLGLNQKELAVILGHKSKTHMSELMNGLKPFTLRDLLVVNRVLGVDMNTLIPTYLSREDQIKVREAIRSLNKPGIKISIDKNTILG